jgi:tetratricopeptide (TPR) repeat protein
MRTVLCLAVLRTLVLLDASGQTDPTDGTNIGKDCRYALEADRSYEKKNWQEAAAAYAQATALNPLRGQYWYRLGLAYYHQKDFDRAIPAFARAADLGSNPAAATYNIAACYACVGKAALRVF